MIGKLFIRRRNDQKTNFSRAVSFTSHFHFAFRSVMARFAPFWTCGNPVFTGFLSNTESDLRKLDEQSMLLPYFDRTVSHDFSNVLSLPIFLDKCCGLNLSKTFAKLISWKVPNDFLKRWTETVGFVTFCARI